MAEAPVFQMNRSHAPEALITNYMLAGNFTLDMHDFFYARMDRSNPHRLSRTNSKLNTEYGRLFDQLKGMLPESGRDLLFDLDSVVGALAAEEQDIMYRSGFSDGVRLILHSVSGAGI